MLEKKKGRAEDAERFKSIPKPDKKNRIILPTGEWGLFLKNNEIVASEKQELVIVPTETAQSFWGMTFGQFKKLADAVREKDSLFLDSIYRASQTINIEKTGRTSVLTFLEQNGLVRFRENERLKIACSLHEDFGGVGYFLKFLPVALKKIDEKTLPAALPIRERIEAVFGAEFSNFLVKMRE
jgi:hypothetical protein